MVAVACRQNVGEEEGAILGRVARGGQGKTKTPQATHRAHTKKKEKGEHPGSVD